MTSRFLCKRSGRFCIIVSMLLKPPLSFNCCAFSNTDGGTVLPDKSSIDAGKFKDAKILK